MRKRIVTIWIFALAILLSVVYPVLASMSFTADETYLYGAISVWTPDAEQSYSLTVKGPDGTFNKGNAGDCYIEKKGNITINYGYMKKGTSFTLTLVEDATGTEVPSFTFFISAKKSGNFLVPPKDDAPTPTPIPTPTPEPTPVPSATPTPVPPIVINTPTPSPVPEPTKAKATPTPEPKATNTPVPTSTPTPVPTDTPTPTPEPTATPTPTNTPKPTNTPTPEPTDTPTPTPSPSPTPLPPPTVTPVPTKSAPAKEIKKAVADIFPGIEYEEVNNELKVSAGVLIASGLIMFIIGFVVVFLIRSRRYTIKDNAAQTFGGLRSIYRNREDEK